MTEITARQANDMATKFMEYVNREYKLHSDENMKAGSEEDAYNRILHIVSDTFKGSFKFIYQDGEDLLIMTQLASALLKKIHELSNDNINPMNDDDVNTVLRLLKIEENLFKNPKKAIEVDDPFLNNVMRYRELIKAITENKKYSEFINNPESYLKVGYMKNMINGYLDGLNSLYPKQISTEFHVGTQKALSDVISQFKGCFIDIMTAKEDPEDPNRLIEDISETQGLLALRLNMIAGQEVDPNNMKSVSDAMLKLGINTSMISENPDENIESDNEFISIFYQYHKLEALRRVGVDAIRYEGEEADGSETKPEANEGMTVRIDDDKKEGEDQ